MACNSDYMEANKSEKNLSIVYGLLDELEIGGLPKNFGDGYKEHLDEKTEELCNRLQSVDVSKYSLELQMWLRDHKKADKDRVEKELAEAIKNKKKEKVLSNLTDYEKSLFGLK